MPEVTTNKPFVFRERGVSQLVKRGTPAQELSAACAAHARAIGVLEDPAPAAPSAEPEPVAGESPAEPETAGRKRK
ncbi:hypothetical protein PCLA_13r0035 [Pseudomonas citronellolis]|uniref:hypothetical protein n=1 Tax=Pseudomonas citronellolis TaxID=53408 RepID=UPI000E2EE23B|nr:hypothetical protein [Pseudomonas citronellolis]GBL59189.1 hypothetical protein PCLA_13r0035 [Pseudomonas citronellolis]